MSDFELNENEKQILLKIARKSVEDSFNNATLDDFLSSDELNSELTGNLIIKTGVFVTLKSGGEDLRGCIGNFVSDEPVYINAYKMAKEAAFSDPRFMPLSKDELRKIKFEISVLSPLEKIDDLDDIKIGKHGIYIIKSSYRGVLLPQVATENHMDRKEFLEAVSLKAGLDRNAYKNGADIYIFSAIVFGEK